MEIYFHLYEINRTPTRYYEHMENLENFFILAGYKVDNIGVQEKSAYIVAADDRTLNQLKKRRFEENCLEVESLFTQSRFVFVDERVEKQFEAYMALVEKVSHTKKSGNRIGSNVKERAFIIKKKKTQYDFISVEV